MHVGLELEAHASPVAGCREYVAAARPDRPGNGLERDRLARAQLRDLDVRHDPPSAWTLDALGVASANAVARDALDVQDAAAPPRIVLWVGEKGKHVVTRAVDDDLVTRGWHLSSPWVAGRRGACRGRSASLGHTSRRVPVLRSCRALARPRCAPPARGTRQ